MLAEVRKFSGNAFYKNGKHAYHHGTLLVDVDMGKLGQYLNPSKAKLHAKGVDSVRCRVVNLKELYPEITIDSLKKAMAAAFEKVYGLAATKLDDSMMDWSVAPKLEQALTGCRFDTKEMAGRIFQAETGVDADILSMFE